VSGERPDSMAKLIIGEAAEAEYQAAAECYAERSSAVADGFTEAVAAAFRRILDRPERGAACDDVHRLVIPPSDPSEPCLEPETVALLRDIRQHAEAGDIPCLAPIARQGVSADRCDQVTSRSSPSNFERFSRRDPGRSPGSASIDAVHLGTRPPSTTRRRARRYRRLGKVLAGTRCQATSEGAGSLTPYEGVGPSDRQLPKCSQQYRNTPDRDRTCNLQLRRRKCPSSKCCKQSTYGKPRRPLH